MMNEPASSSEQTPIEDVSFSEAEKAVLAQSGRITMAEEQTALLDLVEAEAWTAKPQHIIWPGEQLNAAIGEWDEGMMFFVALPSAGKCLKIGTKVMMADGSLRPVEDVKVGEQVMGPDSSPRNVLSVSRGISRLYDITERGETYTVNENHVLSVIRQHDQKILNIPISKYLSYTRETRRRLKGWKVAIDFPKKPVTLDPYFLGVWLGDGTASNQNISNPDTEIITYLQQFAYKTGLKYSTWVSGTHCPTHSFAKLDGQSNVLLDTLRELNLINNKHIPFEYLTNSEEIRLQVLAGILDTDGYLGVNGYSHIFEIVQKNERLADDIAYLARSLGFRVVRRKCTKGIKSTGFKGEYFRLFITGDLYRIPTKVKRKQSNYIFPEDHMSNVITVSDAGVGEYAGFEIDGDHLFVLGNFSVTHNSSTLVHKLTGVLRLNPDAAVLDCSLDDSFRERTRRYISAIVGVPTVKIARPVNATERERKRREQGFRVIRKWMEEERLVIKSDSEHEASNPNKIIKWVEDYHKKYPDRKLIVVVDAFNDIQLPESKYEEPEKTLLKALSRALKSAKAIAIITAHRRKSNTSDFSRRASNDELKGSAHIKHEAKILMVLHNEVNEKFDDAEMYWSTEEEPDKKLPVIEMSIQKNKATGWKGWIFNQFIQETGQSEEVPQDKSRILKEIAMKSLRRPARFGFGG